MTETQALLILSRMPGLGAAKIRALIERFGSALAALDASPEEVGALPGFGHRWAAHWAPKKDHSWQQEEALITQQGATLIPYFSPHYPKRLKALPDAPVLLFVRGELIPEDERSIAIVGTRHASIYGKELAEKIARELSAAGYTIVSGLARGIDTAAHQGALQGRTIAVIGSGLSNIYPPENRLLASEITQNGALISEFPMTTPPDRQNFPQRNRIVSGMTKATLLIEAPLRSGAMITVERTLSDHKPVFVLPGRVDWPTFQGNHVLIKERGAHLIESAQDILKHFDDLFQKKESTRQITETLLNAEENRLLQLLPDQELTFDEIIERTGYPVMKVNALLMSLFLKRKIKEYPGKIYKRTNG